jgi:PEP-CTERM motif
MRRCVIVSGLLLLSGLLPPAPSHAASITFDSVKVGTNESVLLEITVSDVIDLATFGFDLAFNPTVLGSPTITRGTIFDGPDGECGVDDCFFFPGLVDTNAGLISIVAGSLIGVVPGVTGGLLATIEFQSLAEGDGGLALLNVLLQNTQNPGDPDDPDYPKNAIPCDDTQCIQNGVVTVAASPTPVPEPSTLGLMGIGLAALARRFRRKTPAAR